MKQVSGNAEQLARNCRETAKLMGDVGVSMEGKRRNISIFISSSFFLSLHSLLLFSQIVFT